MDEIKGLICGYATVNIKMGYTVLTYSTVVALFVTSEGDFTKMCPVK